jgi:hypothetical protein
VAGSCECGNGTSDSVECRNLVALDLLASQEGLFSVELVTGY